jgi:ribosomal protein S18 acetylase RimI-like enzyme
VSAKLQVAPGRKEEHSELFALARSAFGAQSGWDDGRAVEALETDTVFVARAEGLLAGYVAVTRAGEALRIEQLLVAPHHEGEGVGHRLLEYAEGYAISTGATAVQVVVEDDNERALAFYGRSGFRPVAAQLYELSLPRP